MPGNGCSMSSSPDGPDDAVLPLCPSPGFSASPDTFAFPGLGAPVSILAGQPGSRIYPAPLLSRTPRHVKTGTGCRSSSVTTLAITLYRVYRRGSRVLLGYDVLHAAEAPAHAGTDNEARILL